MTFRHGRVPLRRTRSPSRSRSRNARRSGWRSSQQNPFYPVHRATIEKHDAYLRREGNWTRPGSLVCNGPFVLKEWRTNDAVVVEQKSALLGRRARASCKQVVFHPIDNADTEEKAFRGGLLHVTRYLPAAKLDGYRHPPSPLLHADPLVSTKFVEINVVDARRSTMCACAGRSRWRWTARRWCATSGATAAAWPIAVRAGERPGAGLPAPRAARHGPHASARALNWPRRDFPNGAGLPAVSLLFATAHQGDQALVEAMQAMWQKELGVHVDLVPQEEKVWLDTQRTKNYQLVLYSAGRTSTIPSRCSSFSWDQVAQQLFQLGVGGL